MDSDVNTNSFLLRAGSLRHGYTAFRGKKNTSHIKHMHSIHTHFEFYQFIILTVQKSEQSFQEKAFIFGGAGAGQGEKSNKNLHKTKPNNTILQTSQCVQSYSTTHQASDLSSSSTERMCMS